MRGEVLGRRYAKALFTLTKDDPKRAAIGTLLADLGRALDEHGPLADAVLNPRYSFEVKRTVLTTLAGRAGAGPTATQFVELLLKKNRLRFLTAIALSYQALLDDEAGRARASVTVARPLEADEQAALTQRLETATGKTIVLDMQVNPDILGGVIVRSGSLYYDGSLKGQLERLRQRMTAV